VGSLGLGLWETYRRFGGEKKTGYVEAGTVGEWMGFVEGSVA